MIRRIAGRSDCGNCHMPFKLFETVYYLGIDNNSFCSDCREKLRPGEADDIHDRGGWVPAIFVGFYEDESRENILQLIKLWNESSDGRKNQIEVSK